MAASPLPSRGPHGGEESTWLHDPGNRCGLGCGKRGLKRCHALTLPPESHCFGKQSKRLHDPRVLRLKTVWGSKVAT